MSTAPVVPFEALVFDLDGTLIDSAPDVCAAVSRALTAEGRRTLTVDETKRMLGSGGRALVERALALTGDPGTANDIERALRAFLATYAANPVEHTKVFPGVHDVLTQLQGSGVRLGICTNRPTATTAPVLRALDLDGYFTVVSCGDAVPHRKPDGRHVLDVVTRLGTHRDAAAMIGDNENDINAARDAGVRSVVVTFGYAHAPAATLGADALIDRFEDLPDALSRIAATVG